MLGGLGGSLECFYVLGPCSEAKTAFRAREGWIETDPPARDLYSGSDASGGMDRVTIARHSYKAAGLAPRNVPAGTPLVGGINVGFVDGHAGLVKLEQLWTLTWHNGWVTPATRPK